MKLKKMSLERLRAVYETQLQQDFPPAERKPFSAMESLIKLERYLPYEATDEDGSFLGYALLWSSLPGTYVLLDYLGVRADKRNGGLGGKILALLQEEFDHWQGIIIESEAPDGGAEDALRLRRLDFYRRNGCKPMAYDAWLFGVHYKALLLSKPGAANEAAAKEAHRELYHHYFTPEQTAHFVRVPFDAERDTAPEINWDEAGRLI